MNSLQNSSARLSPSVSAFVLAASAAALFNTALAWAKDASPALNNFMKSVAGHHWTTHGLADLVVFLALGFIFTKTKTAERIEPNRLINILIGSVAVAAFGLAAWYIFF